MKPTTHDDSFEEKHLETISGNPGASPGNTSFKKMKATDTALGSTTASTA